MFKEYDFSIKGTKGRVILLGLLTVLILFGTHTKLFSLAAFVISSLIVIYDKTHFRLMLITYLMLMAHIFKISSSGMSYFTFLMFIYIGLKLYEEKTILWTVVLFIIYVLTVQFINMGFEITDDLKLFGNVLFIGYALSEIGACSDNDKDDLCVTYVTSVLVSSVMRFFDSSFFRISDYTAPLNTEGFGSNGGSIVRFSGLYQDPNYYTVNLIMALCLIVILYYRGRVPILFCAGSAAAILYFGTLTYSKSFLLMLLLPLSVFMFANHRIGRYDIQVISLALIFAAGALILMTNPDFLTGMQKRMETGTSATSGRSDIWLGYLDYIYHHPDIALFGAGIGAELLFDRAIHNVYIEILYHLGLVGGFLLIVAIVNSGLRYRKAIRSHYMNFSVIIGILITYFFLSQLHDYEFPIHFTLAFMVLNQWDLSRRFETEVPQICAPLIPELSNGKVKTLIPTENKK